MWLMGGGDAKGLSRREVEMRDRRDGAKGVYNGGWWREAYIGAAHRWRKVTVGLSLPTRHPQG